LLGRLEAEASADVLASIVIALGHSGSIVIPPDDLRLDEVARRLSSPGTPTWQDQKDFLANPLVRALAGGYGRCSGPCQGEALYRTGSLPDRHTEVHLLPYWRRGYMRVLSLSVH
jgi:hypothetical protein